MLDQFDISMLQIVRTKILIFGGTRIAKRLLNAEVAIRRVSDGTAYAIFSLLILNVQY